MRAGFFSINFDMSLGGVGGDESVDFRGLNRKIGGKGVISGGDEG